MGKLWKTHYFDLAMFNSYAKLEGISSEFSGVIHHYRFHRPEARSFESKRKFQAVLGARVPGSEFRVTKKPWGKQSLRLRGTKSDLYMDPGDSQVVDDLDLHGAVLETD